MHARARRGYGQRGRGEGAHGTGCSPRVRWCRRRGRGRRDGGVIPRRRCGGGREENGRRRRFLASPADSCGGEVAGAAAARLVSFDWRGGSSNGDGERGPLEHRRGHGGNRRGRGAGAGKMGSSGFGCVLRVQVEAGGPGDARVRRGTVVRSDRSSTSPRVATGRRDEGFTF